MAFPTGWTSYQIQSDPTKVSGSSNLTNFPVLIKDGNLSSAVYAGLQQGGATVTATNLETSGTSTDATSFETGSISPTLGRLVLISVSSVSTASAPVNIPTVTGAGMTWTQVATAVETANSYRRITVFRGVSVGSSGALTIDFSGESQLRCGWSITEINNVDTGGTNGSNAIVQSATATQNDGNSYTSLTVNLGAFSSTKNATFGAIQQQTGTATTPGSGFTELGETSALDSIAVTQTEFRNDNDTTVAWTWASGVSRATGIGIELKYKNQGGEDLRITTDSAGTTEVPFEIVSLDTSAETCEIWTKIPTLSYNSGTNIYIWYGNSAALPYDATDTFGSQNVWSSNGERLVHHYEGSSTDSTSYAKNGTDSSITYGTTQSIIGDSFTGTDIAVTSSTDFNVAQNITVSFWVYMTAVGGRVFARYQDTNNSITVYPGSDASTAGIDVRWRKAGTDYKRINTTATYSLNAWHRYDIVWTNATNTLTLYIDGVADTNVSPNTPGISTTDTNLHITNRAGGGFSMSGYMDEFRWYLGNLTADWIATEYNNQNDPSTFWTAVSGTTFVPKMMIF